MINLFKLKDHWNVYVLKYKFYTSPEYFDIFWILNNHISNLSKLTFIYACRTVNYFFDLENHRTLSQQ